MNVLLIDDDRFVVAALQKKIDWTSLSVSEIFSAYNIRQAKKIMEDNSIRICVCDIEMPGGSGLELLAWVREHDIDTEFIIAPVESAVNTKNPTTRGQIMRKRLAD